MISTPAAPWRVWSRSSGTVLADRVHEAGSFWARFRGLMGRPSLAPGEGLYLADASIHMFFMRFPIDAVFVGPISADGARTVVAVHPNLPPWRGIVMPVGGATGVLEIAAGAAERAGVQVGTVLTFESSGSPA